MGQSSNIEYGGYSDQGLGFGISKLEIGNSMFDVEPSMGKVGV
jgi:hypothetical protein